MIKEYHEKKDLGICAFNLKKAVFLLSQSDPFNAKNQKKSVDFHSPDAEVATKRLGRTCTNW